MQSFIQRGTKNIKPNKKTQGIIMPTNSKSPFKNMIISLSAVSRLAILTVATNAVAEEWSLPAKIQCIPSKLNRIGIEDLPPRNIQAHLFEYGGKVTIKREGNKEKYTFGEGSHYYKIKEKTSYSRNFDEKWLAFFLLDDSEWTGKRSYLILKNHVYSTTFHIDLKTLEYYGYDPDFAQVTSFYGSCSILN
jgi:hypothetical protein